MLAVFVGLIVTYVVAPAVLYPVVYRCYRDSQDAALRSAVVALSFAPIGISFVLWLLLGFFPRHDDRLYVAAVIALLGVIGLLDYLWYQPVIARWVAVTMRFVVPRQPLAVIVLIRLGVLVAIASLVIRYALVSGPTDQFKLALVVAVISIALLVMPISVSAYTNITNVWAGLLIIYGVTVTWYAGLGVPLIENDPLEYALVGRAIYEAKSLDIYPLVTALPDSGLYVPWAHPPAFALLHVWGYLFDADYATRILRISPLFYFTVLLFAIYVYLRPYGRLAPIGPAFILSIPFLQYLAGISHIDPMRTALCFLASCLTAEAIGSRRFVRQVLCGVGWGFALYAHSLGLIIVAISGLIYLLLRPGGIIERVQGATLISVFALAIGGYQYLHNLIQFGVPITDSVPVREIPELRVAADLAYRRMLATAGEIVINGILRPFTQTERFGFGFIVAAGAMALWARRLWSDLIFRVMFLTVVLYFLLIILSAIAGSIESIKNARYMMTYTPAFLFCGAALIVDFGSRLASAVADPKRPGALRLGFRGFVLLFIIASTAAVLPSGNEPKSRALYYESFPLVWTAQDRRFVESEGVFYGEAIRFLNQHPGKVLTFRQPNFAFYGRKPWIDQYDPVLIDFYRMTNKAAAYQDLLRRRVSYVFLPQDPPVTFYNSEASEVVADPHLADLMVQGVDSFVYRLYPAPTEVNCTALVPTGAVTQSLLPISYRNILRQILFRTPFPVDQQELSLHFASEFYRLPESAPLEGLASVEFKGISIPEGRTWRGSPNLRLYLTVETGGEGLGAISLKSKIASGAVSERLVWDALLDSSGREVSVQTLLASGVTELSVLIRKQERHMRLTVRGIKLCLFEGPPSLSQK
jgi:hypothetical protein